MYFNLKCFIELTMPLNNHNGNDLDLILTTLHLFIVDASRLYYILQVSLRINVWGSHFGSRSISNSSSSTFCSMQVTYINYLTTSEDCNHKPWMKMHDIYNSNSLRPRSRLLVSGAIFIQLKFIRRLATKSRITKSGIQWLLI